MNERLRRGLAALGLGCWLATVLLYSNTVTPFQRLAGTSAFVGDFAPASLVAGAACALLVTLAALRGHCLPARVLAPAGGAAYVLGAAAFSALACHADAWAAGQGGAVPLSAILALAACVGAGCVGTGLAWGRVFKAFGIRPALACVAGAALVAAALGAVGVLLPAGGFATLFCVEALLAAALPVACGMRDPGCEAALTPEGLREHPLGQRLRSFADVAAPALAGLLAFAFVMGTMRELIVQSYGIHLGVLVACACILAVVLRVCRQGVRSVRGVLSGVIPVLAVLLLAVSNVTAALWGGSVLDMVMVFLLYTLAALLTLGTLAAIAHAGEFPCDLVFSVALLLFCLMSVLGLACAEVMTSEQIKVSTTLITTAYAFAMVLMDGLRGRRARTSDARGGGAARAGEASAADAKASGSAAGGGTLAADGTPATDRVAAACAELAARARLTARETEILDLLARGCESAQISAELFISQNTVRSHVHNLCHKTGAASREELVRMVRG